LRSRGFLGAGGSVEVGERHDVGGDGGLVSVLDPRDVERPRDEIAGYGVGGGGGLDGMEGTAVEFRRMVLIS
jgi:hypothetical protein